MQRALLAILLVAALAGCADSDPGGPEGAGEDGLTDGEGGALAPESGVLSGRLTAVGSSTTQPIAIAAAGHGRLAVRLVLTTNLPQSSVVLNVSGPDGRSDEVDTGPLLYVLPGEWPAVSFGAPGVGDWQASVELESGAAADYEVHWCADDAASPGPSSNLACRSGGGAA